MSKELDKGRRPVGRLRRSFRVLRKLTLLLLFALLSLAIYLNQVGLPEFAEKRLKDAVLAKGWQIDFTRLRLHSWRELAVDGFHLRRITDPSSPEVFVSEAYCRFRPGALRQLQFDLEALRVEEGYLLLPINTNQSRRVNLRQVSGELIVRSDDQWELRNFRARFLGANMQFMGVLTNSSLLRDWKFAKKPSDSKRSGKAFWSNVLRAIEPIEFTGTPQLIAQFYGDAADPVGMEASVRFAAPAVATPWGSGQEVRVLARLTPPSHPDDIVLTDLTISANNTTTPWGDAGQVQIQAQMQPSYPQITTTNALFTIEARKASTRWAKTDLTNFRVRLTVCPTNAEMLQTDITLRANGIEAQGWKGNSIDLTGNVMHPQPKLFRFGETNLPWPERIANIGLVATGQVVSLRSEVAQIDASTLRVQWTSPLLRIDTGSTIAGGRLVLAADLATDTRDTQFRGTSSFDPRALMPMLPDRTQRWLSRYSWKQPPLLAAEGHLRLPAWTNYGRAWVTELLPTVALSGQLKVGNVGFRGIEVVKAESGFALTNFVWTMPNLKIERPEGTIEAQYASDLTKSDFHWRFKGPIDPKAAEPLIETEQQRKIMAELQLTSAPVVDGELWGTWRNVGRLGAAGTVAVSNASFRGQSVTFAQTRLLYTNEILTLLNPRVIRPGEEGSAPGLQIDIPRKKLFITNAFGNLDPHAVVRAIGRQATRAIEPYKFGAPPTTRCAGVVDLKKKSYEDELHFEVAGNNFRWNNFNLDQVSGKIDWVGRHLNLTDLNGTLKSGRATGEARFDFAPATGADFTFKVVAAETDLAEVLAGFGRTNKVEGILSGELVVTSGNSSNYNSWNGHGRVNVRDGLLWDLPMFGMFTPLLNAFMPGMGNSRAREATGTYTITNSVVYSKDVEVHATAMRMNFAGSAAFDGRVNARVEAELLRDFPGIGLFLSKVLWPVTKVFEYKVTGTLSNPKPEPVYVIPKLLLIPLQPFKAIRDIIAAEDPAGDSRPAPVDPGARGTP